MDNPTGSYETIYTNDSGSFNVTFYNSASNGYNNGGTDNPDYANGPKINKANTVFASFPVDAAPASYTFSVTSNAGSANIVVYTDEQLSQLVAQGSTKKSTGTESFVYNKTSNEEETLYLSATMVDNFYLVDFTITKGEPLEISKVKVSGNVKGVESDDTIKSIELKGSTDTQTVTPDEYAAGISLNAGEEYAVTAIGEKGVYKADSITPTEAATQTKDIALTRIKVEFPLDFVNNFDDLNLYYEKMGYGKEDAYSGIISYGYNFGLRNYGVKAAKKDIVTFTADKAGIYTVSLNVTACNDMNNDLILKVNDDYTATYTAISKDEKKLSVMANKGDKITLYTVNVSDGGLYFNNINVEYTQGAFLASESTINNSKAPIYIIYGEIASDDVNSVDEVGFYYTDGLTKSLEEATVADSSSTVYSSIEYNEEQIVDAGSNYAYGTAIDTNDAKTDVYVYTYSKVGGVKYYSAPVKVE